MAQHAGDFELDILNGGFHHFDGDVIAAAEGVDHLVHQQFGGRGAGGDGDAADAFKGAPVDIFSPLHQLRVFASGLGADLDQAARI